MGIEKHKYTCRKRIHRLYPVWTSMKQRCFNEKNKTYKYYGGRGITVCEEWLNPSKFIDWCINNGWKEGLQIDRINNDGNYDPLNCRFVTRRTNINNRRKLNSSQEYIGVRPHRNRWVTKIRVEGKAIHIGMFSNKIDAAVAYDCYAIKYCLDRLLNFNQRSLTL